MNESDEMKILKARRFSSRVFFLVIVFCLAIAVVVAMAVILFYFGMSLGDD